MKLIDFSVTRLQQAELLQLIKRLEEDASSMNLDPKKDAFMDNLYQALIECTKPYAEGLRQVKAHQETQHIAELDEARDNALRSLRRAVSAAQYSPVKEEQTAYRNLTLLLKEFSGIEKQNYEQETALMNTLLKRLGQEEYQKAIASLAIERFITYLSEAQRVFNDTFASRSSDVGTQAVYDMKQLRLDLQTAYMDLCNYVLLLAKTKPDTYAAYLQWVNNSRSYYADLIAHRKGLKKTPPTESK